jgi:hypothetical protein
MYKSWRYLAFAYGSDLSPESALGRQNSSDSLNCNCLDFTLAANNNSDYVPTKVGLAAEKGQISLDSP